MYAQRAIKKTDCFVIERGNAELFKNPTASARNGLSFENKPLPNWHPLICHSRDAMIDAQIAVVNWCVSEDTVDEQELPERVIFSLREPN